MSVVQFFFPTQNIHFIRKTSQKTTAQLLHDTVLNHGRFSLMNVDHTPWFKRKKEKKKRPLRNLLASLLGLDVSCIFSYISAHHVLIVMVKSFIKHSPIITDRNEETRNQLL